jgi:transcriptional regulator with XRE-family HTH domain
MITPDTNRDADFMTMLRRYRLARGLDQAKLASVMNVSVAAVSSWETGRSIPKAGRFEKLARVLGVQPLELTQFIQPSEHHHPGEDRA